MVRGTLIRFSPFLPVLPRPSIHEESSNPLPLSYSVSMSNSNGGDQLLRFFQCVQQNGYLLHLSFSLFFLKPFRCIHLFLFLNFVVFVVVDARFIHKYLSLTQHRVVRGLPLPPYFSPSSRLLNTPFFVCFLFFFRYMLIGYFIFLHLWAYYFIGFVEHEHHPKNLTKKMD